MNDTAAQVRHAVLRSLTGKHSGKVYHIDGEATIGRSGENSILLNEMVVSLQHARLYYDESVQSFVIEDLGSRTGVMVGSEYVDTSAALKHGDTVTIANAYSFEFLEGRHSAGDEPGAPASPTPAQTPAKADGDMAPSPQNAFPAGEAGTGEAGTGETGAGEHAGDEEAPIRCELQTRAGTAIPLANGVNLVGRDGTNGIVLADSSVSRHHAVIMVKDGVVTVRDLDSKNHTFLDGVKVEGEARMKHGSTVLFGLVALELRMEEQE